MVVQTTGGVVKASEGSGHEGWVLLGLIVTVYTANRSLIFEKIVTVT